MILEYAQLLSGAHHYHGSVDDRLYKPTHMKHPSALWVQESRTNYQFVRDLLDNLFEEYDYRYGKFHKTLNMFRAIQTFPKQQPDMGSTPFRLCMPDEYKDEHPVYAYRKFYLGEKSRFAKWSHSDIPLWYYTGDIMQEGFKNIKGN